MASVHLIGAVYLFPLSSCSELKAECVKTFVATVNMHVCSMIVRTSNPTSVISTGVWDAYIGVGMYL